MWLTPAATASLMKATFSGVLVSRFVPSPIRVTSVLPNVSFGVAFISARTLRERRLEHYDEPLCPQRVFDHELAVGHPLDVVTERVQKRLGRVEETDQLR